MQRHHFLAPYVSAILALLSVVVVFSIFIFTAQAQFNEEINYQGKLTDTTGSAVADGTYQIVFRLYTVASGGTAIWTETRSGGNEVQVTNGLFSVMLGDISSLGSVDFNQTLYLGVTVEGDGEMSPRKVIGAVPAAFEAGNTQTFAGIATTSFLRSDQADAIAATTASTLLTITQSGTGNILDLFDGATSALTVRDGGNVGVGTSTPGSRLTVGGNILATGTLTASNFTGTSTGNNTGNVTLAGVPDYLTLAGQQITLGTIDISDDTNLAISALGLGLTGDTIALTAGYSIPLTASSTNWNSFYDTPSTRISAGVGIAWTSNTLSLVTSGDWSGTFDGQEGTYYVARANHTGTQATSTITGVFSDASVADALTVSGGAIGSNTISGTLTTTGALTIGDGGDTIAFNSSNWDISSAGVGSGFTGFTTTGTLSGAAGTFSGTMAVTGTSTLATTTISSGTIANLTLTNALGVSSGGTGVSTVTGLLQGNGTGAFTAITNSSTVGQILRVTGASTYAWGALDLADADAVTGILPDGNVADGLTISGGTINSSPIGATSPSTAVFTSATTTNATTTNLAISGLTSGRVPYISTGGRLIDSANFTFSGSNLGVSGTTTSGFFSGVGTALTSLNATQLTTGTVPSARIAGSYTGITGLGTITTGTWQGTAISSTYLDTAVILETEIDTSSELATILTDETGTGVLVFGTSPTIATPTITGLPTFSGLTANRLISTATGGVATTTISLANVVNSISDVSGSTGTGNLVLSASPTFTGTATFANLTTTNATTTALAVSSLTSGRVPFVSTGGRLIDDANFTFNGTNIVLGGTDGVQFGGDVTLNRGVANRLDLATGDSMNLVSGNYEIAGTDVLTSNTLGAGVVNSSLTNLGTLTALTVSGTSTLATTTINNLTLTQALTATSGGTGQSTYTTGDFLYSSATNVLSKRAIGTTGQILSVSGGLPTWTSTSTLGLGNGRFTGLADTISSYNANRVLYTSASAVIDNANFTFDGTTLAIPAATLTSTLTMSGTAANIALGSNYLSGDGGDEGIFVDGSGNVGIGTTTPGSTLTVAGTTNITGNTDIGGGLDVAGNITVTGTVDGKDIATNAAMLNEVETITANWVNTANPWADNEVADILTISGGTIGSNNISGTLTTTGTLTIGDGGDNVVINSNTWDISGAGVASGLTGLTTSGTVTFSGLTANRLISTATGGVATTTITLANVVNSISDVSGSTGTGNLVLSASPTFTGTVTAATVAATTLTGAGSGITALNASNLSSGTVPDARISGSYTGLTNLTGTGNVDFSRFLGNASDSVTAPSYSWTGDTDTGMYTPGANQIGFTTASTSRMTIGATGVVNITGSLTLGTALAVAQGGTGATTAAAARTNLGATTVGANIFTLTNPSAIRLIQINADNTVTAIATSTLGLSSSFSTSAQLAALLSDETGTGNAVFSASPTLSGTTTLAVFLASRGVVGSNYSAASVPTNGLLVEGSVGIGTTTPGSTLTVTGTTNITGNTDIGGGLDVAGNITVTGTVDGKDIATNGAFLNEAETITANWVNTANPWAINEGGTGAATAAAARTNLGVDAAGTDNSVNVTLAGTPDYITIAGQVITRGLIDLTTDVTGALPIANGGLGAAFTDPNADRLMFFDDSAGSITGITTLSGLAISGTTLTVNDLTCTDCIGPTEITDSYVLNTGDTMTGDLLIDKAQAIIDLGDNTTGSNLRLYGAHAAGAYIQAGTSSADVAAVLNISRYLTTSTNISDMNIFTDRLDLNGHLYLGGSSANIALGSNYLSGDGGDEGILVDANGNVTVDGGRLGVNTSVATSTFAVSNTLVSGVGVRGLDYVASINSFAPSLTFNDISTSANDYAVLVNDGDMNFGQYTASTSMSTYLTLADGGNVGIGSTTPSSKLSVAGTSRFTGASVFENNITLGVNAVAQVTAGVGDIIAGDTTGGFQFDASANDFYAQQSTSDAGPAQFLIRKSRGTATAPSAVSSGDDMFMLRGYAYSTSSAFSESARMTFDTTGTVGATVPGIIQFATRNAAGSFANRLTIDAEGQLGIGTTSPVSALAVTGSATITGNTSIAGDITVSGGDMVLGTTNILSGGDTTSLNNIDAINATTETTLEAAIDSLTSLTAVGTITTGTWNASPIGIAYGGLGAAFTDPNADRLMFFDDSAGAITGITTLSGLAISGTTLTVNDVTCTNCINETQIEDIYVLNTGDTMTGDLVIASSNALRLRMIDSSVGTELGIAAGDFDIQLSANMSSSTEALWLAAESGIRIVSSPDNLSSGWAGRNEAVLVDAGGNSTLPGNLGLTGSVTASGTGAFGGRITTSYATNNSASYTDADSYLTLINSDGNSGSKSFMRTEVAGDGYFFGTRFNANEDVDFVIGRETTANTFSERFTLLENGHVGIGESLPGSKLEVWTSSTVTGRTSNTVASIVIGNRTTTNNNHSDLRFDTTDLAGVNAVGAKIAGIFTSHATSAVTAELGFFTSSAGTLTERMTIDTSGNVGIGSTTPVSTLSVKGDITVTDQATFELGADVIGNITVTGLVDGKDIATNGAFLNEAETITANWVNTANPWADNEVADTLTVTGGTLGSNNIASAALWTTLGTLTIGDGGDNIVINSNTWDISGAGVASGLTGLTTSGTVNLSGLTASRLVATDGSKNLISSITQANLEASITDATNVFTDTDTNIYRNVNTSNLGLYGGTDTNGANIELYGGAHASQANNAYYDANLHTFRSAAGASTTMVVTPGTGVSITGNLTISGTVDGKDIANNGAFLNEAETITANWVNTANPWADNEVADILTISGGTIGSNNISGTLTTTAAFAIGDGGDTIAVNSSNWDVSTAGVFSGGTWQGNAIASAYLDAAVILSTEIDTYAELNAIVADQTLATLAQTQTFTGVKDFTGSTVGTEYGINGRYTDVGGGSTFGATIWSLDTTWQGAAAGNGYGPGPNAYSMSWLRNTNASTTAAAGEGLYIHVAGARRAAIGALGLAVGGSDQFTVSNVGAVDAVSLALSSTLTLSGTAANIALGSNWLSGDGADEGISIDATGLLQFETSSTTTNAPLVTYVAGDNRAMGLLQPDNADDDAPWVWSTANSFQWRVDATDALAISPVGKVGIGATTSLDAKLTVVGTTTLDGVLQMGMSPLAQVTLGTGDIVGGDTTGGFHLDASGNDIYLQQSDATASAPHFFARKSRGTASSPSPITSADDIFLLRGYAANASSTFDEAARITFDSEGTITGTAVPGVIRFYTSTAAGSITERLTINSAGTTTVTGNLAVTGTIDGKDIANNGAFLNEAETITANWVNTANPWADNEVADILTISGGTIGSNNISGTLTTTALLTIGDGGDDIVINGVDFDVTAAGAVDATSLTLDTALAVTEGGTGAASFTAGRVLFGNGTSVLGNSANLFWDNTSSQLRTTGGFVDLEPLFLTRGVTTEGLRAMLTSGSYGFEATDKQLRLTSLNNGIAFYASSTEAMRVSTDGNVGIGTTTPSVHLDVAGATNQAAILGTGVGATSIGVSGYTVGSSGIALNGYTSGSTAISVRGEAIGASSYAGYFLGRGYFSGNVGVGITNPTYDFMVRASTTDWATQVFNTGVSGYGLYVRGGATDGSTDALLVQNNAGTSLMLIQGDGNVGLGDVTPTEAKLVVGNAGAGDIFFTPAASTTANKALCWDAVGASLIMDCGAAPIADYAEAYATEGDVDFGHIVMTTDSMVTQTDGIVSPRLARATAEGTVIGITSNNYGDFTSTGHGAFTDTETKMPVALSGRVPVKVNNEGGAINQGDAITISSVPGIGKKAEHSGETIVGIALADEDTDTNTVLVFVTNDTHITIADRLRANLMSADLDDTDAFTELLSDTTDTIWNRLTKLAQGFVDGVLSVTGVKTDSIETDELCVGTTCITEAELIELLEQNNTSPAPVQNDPDPEPEIEDPAPEGDTEVVPSESEEEPPTEEPEEVIPEEESGEPAPENGEEVVQGE